MGDLWTDYKTDGNGMIEHGFPRNQAISIPGLYIMCNDRIRSKFHFARQVPSVLLKSTGRFDNRKATHFKGLRQL